MAVWVTSVSTPGSRLPPFHPLRLSPHRQWQSSPWICSLIPTFQLPAPVLTSGHTSQSGAHRAVTWTVYVGHSLSCLPQTRHFTLFQQPQILLFCPNWFPCWWGGFPGRGNLSSSSVSTPPGAQVPSHFLSSSFSLLISFVLPSYARIFPVLSSVQGPLLVFSWCSVRIDPSVDVFLMHLWREITSTSSYSSAILKKTSTFVLNWHKKQWANLKIHRYVMQVEKWKKNRKKNDQRLRKMWYTIKSINIHVMGVLEERETIKNSNK